MVGSNALALAIISGVIGFLAGLIIGSAGNRSSKKSCPTSLELLQDLKSALAADIEDTIAAGNPLSEQQVAKYNGHISTLQAMFLEIRKTK